MPTRIILTVLVSISLGGCFGPAQIADPAPTKASPLEGGCEGMRETMPIKYHANTTDAETIANVRKANAAFRATCP
jgi:hypothetical protein